MNLEKAVVHEKHEQTRTNSNTCQDLLCHPLGVLVNLCNQLFSFVNFVDFVSFVDEKPF